MKSFKGFVISICALSLMACTENPSPTTYGAAAGGVLGAGLGAIVGSQVGNAGVGVAIGAASGAAAGAAIGHAIEGQDARIASNEERLNRQEETIKAQRAELNSLRGVSYDSQSTSSARPTSFNSHLKSADSVSAPTRFASASEIAAARAAQSNSAQANSSRARINTERFAAPVAQSDNPVEFSKPSSQVSFAPKNNSGLAERDLVVAPTTQIDGSGNATATSAVNRSIDSSECTNAEAEIQKADKVIDSSDKLFHIRRALRLCPTNANYHSQLADLYLSMNRSDDARFEYQEALKLDPSLTSAQSGLENLQRGSNSASKEITFGGGAAPKLPSNSKNSSRY